MSTELSSRHSAARGLTTARALWVAVSVLALALFIASLPPYYDQLRVVCSNHCGDWQPAPEAARELRRFGVSLSFFAAYGVAVQLGSVLTWYAVAAVVFWRRSADRMVLPILFFLVMFGASTNPSDPLSALMEAHPELRLPINILQLAGLAFFTLFFYVFPNGQLVPRWSLLIVVVQVGVWTPSYLFPKSPLNLDYWSAPAIFAWFAFYFVSGVAAQVYRYRQVSTQIERQQTKWAVFGLVTALVGFMVMICINVLFPSVRQSGTPGNIVSSSVILGFILLIPVSIGIAILRSRLYEIDVLINRTLVYGALSASLAAVYFSGVALIQYLLRGFTGEDSQLAVVVSTLAIAALFIPLRRRIQSLIDRRFYRRKYDAAKTLQTFSEKLRDETELDQLVGELVGVVRETMQPEHVSLWLRTVDREARR